MDADFLNLFDFVMDNHDFGESSSIIELPAVHIKTKQNQYTIEYTDKMPLFHSSTV